MQDWLRYHNYCMREVHHIAFLNLLVAGMATLVATTAAFSHGDTFHKILSIALWWVVLVRSIHTNRIRPKQHLEEKQ